MATQIQWRKGTTAQHTTFTGAIAEVTIDTDKKVTVVHDGSTAGGIPTATEASVTNHINDATDAHAASAITNTPAGGIAATTVQAAINELDTEKLETGDIGVSVQAYDANTAKLNVAQTWPGAQRGTITTDNDGSFNQAASNNFFCTPTGAAALTFTNHTAGQSGLILFVNGSNYAITAAATTYIAAADLAKLSVTGTYVLAYIDNGTNAYCTVTAALTSAGA